MEKIGEKVKFILFFIALLWIILFIDILPFIELKRFGLIPRNLFGLIGIFTSPFLHGGYYHLVSNTVPLFFLLLTLLVFYEKEAVKVIVIVILLGGIILWLIGNPGNHIGASGLIYGIAGFLFVNGAINKSIKAIMISFIVIALYGFMVHGLFPKVGRQEVSWMGHLCYAISGVIASFIIERERGY